MGREGEVVDELVAEFEREHPDIRVEVQQLPWTAAHEKLLTAFAGETLPDLCQLGNTWVPEFAALDALEPLDGVHRALAGRRSCDDYFAGIWTPTASTDALYGVPVVRRYAAAVLPARPAAAGRVRRAAATLGGMDATCWPRSRRMVGPDRYAVLLPLNEFEPLLVLALQQPTSCCARTAAGATSAAPDFRRALAFYHEHVRARLGAAHDQHADLERLGRVRQRAISRSTSPGPGTSASSSGGCRPTLQDAWMTAPLPGPDGPGRLDRRRLEPGGVSQSSQHKDAGVAAGRIPVAAATCSSASTR